MGFRLYGPFDGSGRVWEVWMFWDNMTKVDHCGVDVPTGRFKEVVRVTPFWPKGGSKEAKGCFMVKVVYVFW